jgi:peptidoglycan-N-acetylglucosamine deacetylase
MDVTASRAAGRGAALVVVLVTAGLLLVCTPPAPAASATACSRGTIALTFDDGPHPTYTPRLLDVLQRKRVKATFFQVGRRIDAAPGLTRRAHAEGHRIANHTWGHEKLTALGNDQIRSTLRRTNRRVTDLGLPAPTLVRPPYGATNARVSGVIRDLGMHQRLWTVDPQDWRSGRSADTITRAVLANLHDGANVLLHDGVGNSAATVAAVPRIIDGARARGYCVGTLNAKGQVRPPVPKARATGSDVLEGPAGTNRDAYVTVRLSEPTSRAVTVAFRTGDDTATAPDDYRAKSGTLRFEVGQVSKRIKVRIRGDDLDERNERLRVVLSAPAGVRLAADPSARIKIIDDDEPPVVRVDDATVVEGASGERTVVAVPVRLSAPSGKRLTVTYRTVNVTARAGADYLAASGTVSFAPGQRRADVLVTVLGDARVEGDETFHVELRDPWRVTLGRALGVVTIRDDDVVAAGRSPGGASVAGEDDDVGGLVEDEEVDPVEDQAPTGSG